MKYSVKGHENTRQDAIDVCTGWGWTVETGENIPYGGRSCPCSRWNEALVCMRPHMNYGGGLCSDCDAFRILVWKPNSSKKYYNGPDTSPGNYYRGKIPCTSSWGVAKNPYCGKWRISGILFAHNTLLLFVILSFYNYMLMSNSIFTTSMLQPKLANTTAHATHKIPILLQIQQRFPRVLVRYTINLKKYNQ